ncbi:MAG: hypothetical protein DRR19_24590 [Candidatus Parabeggiatoa sp. nov. 1]|nr:MAG: hypothetical protein DRR19_24590 [Gammaproteobacteria bacterium]
MKENIVVLIVVGPLLVNLLLMLLFFIAQGFFLAKKSRLFMLVVMYLLLNGLLPFLIGELFLIDQADENYHRELLALVLGILMFRMVDIFCFGLGKIFKEIWNYK